MPADENLVDSPESTFMIEEWIYSQRSGCGYKFDRQSGRKNICKTKTVMEECVMPAKRELT
jgi:hypothetical protein